ncbi:TPA: hypothetical protein TZM76_001840 [Streptococcus suis]|uniref:Uncharacterized protein n=1 Tax=Streptococcus suis TaxID=1307 RepID=A0A0Z8HA24_STRSU|nr:hypothetical protein [Streptococcus suis]MBM0273605.1 hypothetical protein [Streptococcus suis]MBS8026222.1 hypothetical protein [Streptococcus suis]MCK4074529.1 hypothetical protein [Streptococcus suis]MCO8220344.1 hypothetical protein [Streptococcus suis]MDX5038481.1 hypothetical protein [Streptococcus suis]
MEATQVTLKGRLLGASKVKDFSTGLDTGQTGLTLGLRSDGRFHQTNIKADRVNISDFEELFDEKVEIILENVSINAYTSGNRAALSVKAQSAIIELV